MRYHHSFPIRLIVAVAIVVVLSSLGYAAHFLYAAEPEATREAEKPAQDTINLTDAQVNAIKVEKVVQHTFRIEKTEVGSVAYRDKGAANVQSLSHVIIANVLESDSPAIHVGETVQASLLAYPDRIFDGKVSAVGVSVYDAGGTPALDPATHRIAVRCEMADPKGELYPGMLGNVTFQIRKPTEASALPENGVVREGDGTMTAWVTADRRNFARRVLKVGLRQDGYVQILDGLQPGELAVSEGAVFLSNMLYALPNE